MDRFDVFVIGARAIRVEFAQICMRFGNQVTLGQAAAVGNLLGLESGSPACSPRGPRERTAAMIEALASMRHPTADGELLRSFTLDPSRDYEPRSPDEV